jgi:hypothetical protein
MRQNSAAIALRFGLWRSMLASIEQRPLLAALAVAVLYGVVGAITWLAPPISWGPQAPQDDYFRDLQTVNLALFGAQATLLGLVYPLVIALVGMLFGQRSSSDRRLDVYFSETEAVTVGGLALGLVGAIALQALAYGQLELKVVGAITVLNSLWFVVNLWALAFFVLRSLDFIRPARRRELVKSYMANTAFSRQLRSLMMTNRWAGAPTYEYLPKLQAPDATMLPGFGEGPERLVQTFKGRRQIKDVRFGLLASVLTGHKADEPPIGFSVRPEGVYEDKAVLVTGGQAPLNWTERLFLRLAFRWGPAPRVSAPPASEVILKEAVGDLLGLVGSGRYDEFEARMDEAVELHTLLYRLAQEPKAAGDFNYAMEADFRDLTPLGRRWVQAYGALIERIGEPLDVDGRFYQSCAYFPGRIARDIRNLPFAARSVLYGALFGLFRATLTGAVRRHRESSATPPPAGQTFSLQGVGSEFHRRNLISFVAGWEFLGAEQIPRVKEEKAEWSQLGAILPDLKMHLRDTVMMTALAAQSGERQAIGWLSDLLLKWRDHAQRRLDPGNGAFALQRSIVSLALIDKPWAEVAALPLSAWDQAFKPIEVFDAGMENLWTDSLMVLVTTLAENFGLPEADWRVHNGAAVAAGALFRNEVFDTGAGGHPDAPPLSARGVLSSILRIAGVGERYEDGYAGDLSELAESIQRLEGPNYVSFRVYSLWGGAGFQDQTHTQVLLLAAALDPSGASASDLVADLKVLLLPREDRAKRRILYHLAAMREAAKSVELAYGRGVVATLRNEDVSAKQLEERLAATAAILQQCEAEIRAARDAEITAAEIDPGRLERLVGEVAQLAFDPATAGFPVQEFKAVERVAELLPQETFELGIDKGALTDPVLGDVSEELGSRWAVELIPVVGGRVLAAVVASRRPIRRRPKDADTYWTALKEAMEAVKSAGQTPVIVRPNRHQPVWLRQWHFGGSGGLPRPSDMTIARRDVADGSYDFDLNGVAVHSSAGTGNATWVFGLETLEAVSFQLYGPQPFEARFVSDPADRWSGVLHLGFGVDVAVSAGPLWRLEHPALMPPRKPRPHA